MGKKYSNAQKRLGALEVNDDMLKDEHAALTKKVKELLAELKEVKKDRESLRVRNNRLERDVKDLKSKIHIIKNKNVSPYDPAGIFKKYVRKEGSVYSQKEIDNLRKMAIGGFKPMTSEKVDVVKRRLNLTQIRGMNFR